MTAREPDPRTSPEGARWKTLLWFLLPFVLVGAAVLWLWLGGEGGFSQAGRYRTH